MDEPYRPTVHSQADLDAVWSRLMGPWGFGRRSVWLLRIDADRRAIPALAEITECDDDPDPATIEDVAGFLRMLDEDDPGASFAFLVSRPGPACVDDADRAWGRFLVEAGRAAGVPLEMPHLATDDGVLALPPDELLHRRTA